MSEVYQVIFIIVIGVTGAFGSITVLLNYYVLNKTIKEILKTKDNIIKILYNTELKLNALAEKIVGKKTNYVFRVTIVLVKLYSINCI